MRRSENWAHDLSTTGPTGRTSYEGCPNSIRHWLPSLEVKGLHLVLKIKVEAVPAIIPSKLQMRCSDCLRLYCAPPSFCLTTLSSAAESDWSMQKTLLGRIHPDVAAAPDRNTDDFMNAAYTKRKNPHAHWPIVGGTCLVCGVRKPCVHIPGSRLPMADQS